MQRAYRYRFYPTAEQRLRFEAHFGAARWVWNRALEFRTKAYRRRGESVTGVDFSRLLTRLKRTARYGWLRDTPSTVLTQKLRDQDRAFANFFAGRAKYPRFRKRRTAQSIRFQLDQRQVHRTFDANFLHHVSRRLVDENQAIVTETLNVRGMLRNRRLARAIADAGWGELVRQIAYKAEWAGRVHVRVDPWFPSTKRCSACHAVRDDLTLADRRWRCQRCGTGHDRDVNAARNLAQEGQRLLNEQRPRGLGRSMRVEGGPSGGVPAQAVNEPAPGETRTDSTRMKRYGTAEAA